MERDLLALFTGDSGGKRLQGQGPLPPPWPSPTLSLCLGSEEERRNPADHGRAPQRERAQAAANAATCSCPSTSHGPFVSSLVSVVVPGHPATAVGPGAWPQTGGPMCDHGARSDCLLQRPSMAASFPSLEPIYPTTTTTTATRREQCRCDASSLCAQLMQGLAGDLDRARAQVALLTCENESLRHRLKRAAAEAGATETAAPSTTTRLHGGLRCRTCHVRPATVVLAPREHLCLCARCSDACRNDPAVACWVCRAAAVRSGAPAAAAPR